MQTRLIEDRRYLQFSELADEPGLVHAFSTRPHNMSPKADVEAGADANRAQFALDFDLSPNQLSFARQIHEPKLAVIDATHEPGPVLDVDGLLTATSGRALMTFSADCPLVLVYDPQTPAVGTAHASWRCTVANIATALVERMSREFGSQPGDCFAAIGPGAGPEHYEVRNDVYDAASHFPDRDRFFPRRDGRMYFDLWAANTAQLAAAGVAGARIFCSGLCTMTHTELFYSNRAEGGIRGLFALLVALR